MKKLLSLLIAGFNLICAVSVFGGCQNENEAANENNLTATLPSDVNEFDTQPKPQPQPDLDPDRNPYPIPRYEDFCDFNEFRQYYETEFFVLNSEKFYLLQPEMEAVNAGYTSYFVFHGEESWYENSPFINPYATETFFIYCKELGGIEADDIYTGLPEYTLEIEVKLKALPENHIKNRNFIFEFSDYIGQFKWRNTVKIYEDGIIIAECNFNTSVEVPNDWIENYFHNNLI